ncbi:MAG: hypothetical protein PHR00_01080 [Patescibacteria group bacterium]|nr:hypothetical protein [Patescibacteria group bacterium]
MKKRKQNLFTKKMSNYQAYSMILAAFLIAAAYFLWIILGFKVCITS